MPTMDEYLTRPLGVRLDRLRSTPAEVARRLEGRDAAALSRRPDAGGWSAGEIVALAAWGIGGKIGHPLDPDRWADDRQYERQDAIRALEAFGRRRGEVVTLLDALSPTQWQRGGIHQARGRMNLGEWVASLAGHDDNHLDQLRQTLELL
jgi:DinB superfamily